MSKASIYNHHRKLRAYVAKAQYDYNCLVDDRWAAKDMSEAAQDAIEDAFTAAENRLFQFERVLEEFERDNADVLAEMEE